MYPRVEGVPSFYLRVKSNQDAIVANLLVGGDSVSESEEYATNARFIYPLSVVQPGKYGQSGGGGQEQELFHLLRHVMNQVVFKSRK